MATFSLKVLAADKKFYTGRCNALIVPALDGELEIMSHHEDMVIATKEGTMRFKESDDSEWRYAVVGLGFVHIANNRVTYLVDTAERPEDIDRVRAERAKERAEEQMRQKQSIAEYHVSQASLARAMVRLKEAGRVNINNH
ncbi:MAG: ATP synthase F1 subunit epsilon [Lachnospiraceae bacterium]|nr:ATP synthase F1 subunit epsilon [Lachnospiraceae bacterium]